MLVWLWWHFIDIDNTINLLQSFNMFGLNPVKMTMSYNASSWIGNRKTLQKSPTKNANSQGAKESEVVGGGKERVH